MSAGKTVVIGATGFVGRQVCAQLQREGTPFTAVGRGPRPTFVEDADYCRIPSLPEGVQALEPALSGATSIIYLAARVHAMEGDGMALLPLYRSANLDAPLAVAERALDAGVRRFVYVSTIKVHGQQTTSAPFRASDPLMPSGAYATSKAEAEERLASLIGASDAALSIVRPPLVYGPGVAANFARLFAWVARGVPLPLGAIHNRRSLVSVQNLADLLLRVARDDRSHRLLVSDGAALSTPDLVRAIARALGVAPRLVPVPERVLVTAAGLLGRAEIVRRLTESLEVDASPTGVALNWRPPVTMYEELRRMAKDDAGR